MTSVLILNGPNLGRLGRREPEVYGRRTHDQLAAQLIECGSQLGLQVEVRQTDAEAEMISWLHEAADRGLPVVLNAAAWTHYSVAVADAVAQLGSGLIEVHLSNVYAREEFRRVSLISAYADGVIVGLGALGYDLALRALAQRNEASA